MLSSFKNIMNWLFFYLLHCLIYLWRKYIIINNFWLCFSYMRFLVT